MAHTVWVTLTNEAGLRLGMPIGVPMHTTGHENEAWTTAENRANADAEHAKYGPWTAKSSKFG